MKNIKTKIIAFVCLFACLIMMPIQVYAHDEAVTITSASANTTEVTVNGTTNALAVMVQVRDASNNILVMQSFGTTSSAFTGTISGLALTEGATYTVYVADYEGGDWATKEVTVPVGTVAVTGVTLDKESSTLTTAGETLQLTATVAPANATNKAVTWTSSNPAVATVDATGKVTAVANGTTTITVTTTDGAKTAQATITVAIEEKKTDVGNSTDNGSTGDNVTITPNKGDAVTASKTGDLNNTWIWFVLLFAGAAFVVVRIILAKKQKR